MTGQPTVLLGVTGGIAAYKSAELLRGLQKAGMDVRVIMTDAATRFVAPLTFETLSGHAVHTGDLLRADSTIAHIEEGNAADLFVIAPLTANTLAKMANGLADNLLTATYLAYSGTVVAAPSMNTNMWNHPATQRNVATLREQGVFVVEPGAGELACGVYGSGRMAEPDSIVAEVKHRLQVVRKTDLRGMRVAITAGGTREPIDAVRYMGNRSSGKMGVALARAAFDRGASVDLIKANIDLPRAPGVREHDTPTARAMYRKVMDLLPDIDILFMAAAVADYQAIDTAAGKMGKSQDHLSVRLEPTADILCEVATERRDGQFIVGFAAEFGPEGLSRSREKLKRKNLDMIVFNDISRSDIGFNSDYNEVIILTPGGESKVGRAPKETVAEIILDHTAREVRARRGEFLPVT
ncbi:MAG: bifunctional phosphopantothenoylcysteine decarboxylase/phosphopantothenate--cysteine ligase CoaBC [Actinobacteria bacterium]|nr:bifunctional phosphopantothenoylcysteine decarboxylase/phosphopantothenate--cysteine ligase CoaBC [Actinomycetota bacterium]